MAETGIQIEQFFNSIPWFTQSTRIVQERNLLSGRRQLESTVLREFLRYFEPVISYEYWGRAVWIRSAVTGKQIVLNNTPFSIIGVTAPKFFGLEPGEHIDVSIPLTTIERVWPGYAGKERPSMC